MRRISATTASTDRPPSHGIPRRRPQRRPPAPTIVQARIEGGASVGFVGVLKERWRGLSRPAWLVSGERKKFRSEAGLFVSVRTESGTTRLKNCSGENIILFR